VRVFVVEDEAIIAMELEDRVETLGYEVCGHAASGKQALSMILAARPDVVLMDINLGAGLTGLEVADKLRGQVDAEVIFLTAYTSAEIEARSRTNDSRYLVKPFSEQALRDVLETCEAKRRAAPAT
jgi:CheY-like chemotaxis protein